MVSVKAGPWPLTHRTPRHLELAVVKLRQQGLSFDKISRALGMGKTTVERVIKRHKNENPRIS